ncbi:hypothetical protein EGR_05599 [Echinococcus granulosus]|uniref:Uncharacterized protein n=1 Tax=Echinococcus granulosus TaxID=6210 RepID=W6UN30_ECHGR|nr:hypothetical protein EGR_05599 [Echinococcus granulosus]EUB59572.1 hypothetical protein EGR_05599 [Echinococcus granulosus]
MMIWIIQVENGSLLNVIFENVSSAPRESPRFELTPSIKHDFFTNMLLLRPLPLSIIKAMPDELGGGQAGVDSAHAHPNREPIIFWLTVALFLFVVVLIICIQIINCCFCNSKSTAAPPTKSRRKHLVCRIIFITLLAIELLLVAASVFLLVVYFCSMDLVVSYLKAQPQTSPELTHIPTSLPDGLHAVLMHTSGFIREGIQSGRMHTISTVKTFKRNVSELDKSIEGLLISFKIKEVLNVSNSTFQVFENFVYPAEDAIQKIIGATSFVDEISIKMNSSMQLFNKAFSNFSRCDQTPLCLELKNATEISFFSMNYTSLDTKTMEQVMRTLNDTLLQLHNQLNQVNSLVDIIHNKTNDILLLIEAEMDFDQIFSSIDNFWMDVSLQADDFVHQFNLIVDSFERHLGKAIGPIKTTLYCVGGCLTIIILFATIVTICVIYHVTRSGLSFDSGKGCLYLVRESAINKTDFILNGYVAQHWNLLIHSAISEVGDFVFTASPKNPLFSLAKTCNTKASRHKVGLLSALGYSNMVNTSQVVSSSAVTQGFAKGKEIVLQELQRINIPGTLPDVSQLAHAKEELNDTMKALDLNSILNLLDPTMINTAEVAKFMAALIVFIESDAILDRDEFNVGINSLIEVVEKMDAFKLYANETLQSILNINGRTDGVITSFDTVFTAFIDFLKVGKNESTLMAEVEKQYDAAVVGLKEFMKVDGDRVFARLTQKLLPCSEAHAAYTVAMEVTCGESGVVKHLLGLVYVLALNVVFLVLLYLGLLNLANFHTLQVHFPVGEAASAGGDDGEKSTTSSSCKDEKLP